MRKPVERKGNRCAVRVRADKDSCGPFVSMDLWTNSYTDFGITEAESLGRWLLRFAEWAREQRGE